MDIGALLQSFAGEPMAPLGTGSIDKANRLDAAMQSADTTADGETTSFIQVVRQMLGTRDCAEGMLIEAGQGARIPSDEVSRSSLILEILGQSADTTADGETTSFIQVVRQMLGSRDGAEGMLIEAGQGARIPSDEVSRSSLILEVLGQWGIGESQPGNATLHDQETIGVESELVMLLNERLSSLVGTTLTDVSTDTAQTETDPLTLLNDNVAALEASIAGPATVFNMDAGKDLGQNRDYALHPAKDESKGGEVPAEGKVLTPKSDFPGTTMTTGQQTPIERGGDGDSLVDSVDEPTDAGVIKKQATRLDWPKESTHINILGSGGSESSAPEEAVYSDRKIAVPKPLDPNLTSQGNQRLSMDVSDQPPTPQNVEKPRTVESEGLNKKVSTGELKATSTPTGPIRASGSPREHDERFFDGEKQSSANGRAQQAIDSQSTKMAASDLGETDTLLNNSMKAMVSAGSTIDGRPLIPPTIGGALPQASSDSAFQKTVMDQIVEKATLRSVNDRSEIRIQLKPDTLGDVRMSIVAEKNQMVVQMIADKPETKEIIESQLHHLKAELDKQGLTVGKIEVMISAGNDQQDSREQFFQMFKNNSDGRGKRRNSDQQESPSQNRHSDESEPDSTDDGINYFV